MAPSPSPPPTGVFHWIRSGYITPPSPRNSTLTINITGNTSARYVTTSTLTVANRTTKKVL